ncbi:hypothetical protein HC761_02290, partial [bacterium]|nr:hypothetical protein [bacterium]
MQLIPDYCPLLWLSPNALEADAALAWAQTLITHAELWPAPAVPPEAEAAAAAISTALSELAVPHERHSQYLRLPQGAILLASEAGAVLWWPLDPPPPTTDAIAATTAALQQSARLASASVIVLDEDVLQLAPFDTALALSTLRAAQQTRAEAARFEKSRRQHVLLAIALFLIAIAAS